MLEIISIMNSTTFVPELFFGYYSANGVCLPRLFSQPDRDQAYEYSLFIVLINFSAFIYLAFAYFKIYRLVIFVKTFESICS